MKVVNLLSLCIGVFILSVIPDAFAIPGTINFQGKIEVQGVPFNGDGTFRFSIVDEGGSSTYWTSGDIEIPVTGGIYNVILGADPDMSPIPATVFGTDSLFIRIWFDDGVNGMQMLSPDQPLGSTAFSFKAADADALDGYDSSHYSTTNHTHSFSNITGSATDAQVPDTHTHTTGSIPAAAINATGLNADTVDSLHGTQFLRKDQSDTMNGTLSVTGNVGIGTTTPYHVLHITKSDTSNPVTMKVQNTAGGSYDARIILGTSTSSAIDTVGAELFADRTNAAISGDTDLHLKTSAGTTMNTNMVIKSGGNVGIGTTSPIAKLEISSPVTGPALVVGRKTGEPSIQSSTDADGHLFIESNGGRLGLNNYMGDNVVMVNGGGNVGIGTTSPIAKLEISSPVTGPALVVGRKTGEPSIQSSTDADGHLFIESNGGRLGLNYYVEDNVALVNGGGNVGVGTINPRTRLHVHAGTLSVYNPNDPLFSNNGGTMLLGPIDGTANSATGGIFSGWQGGSNPTIAMYVTRDGHRTGFRAEYGEKAFIRTSNLDRLTVDGNGNVGIGTSSPSTRLHVHSGALSIFNSSDPLFSNNGGTILLGPTDGTANTATGGIFSGWQGQGIPTVGMYVTRDGSNTGIRADYHGNITLSTGHVDRMVLNIQGYLGVGTLDPQAPLDVVGNIRSSSDLHAGDDVIATDEIRAGTDVEAANNVNAGGNVTGDDVNARDDVEAEDDIFAGDKIKGARIEATSEYICPSADLAEKLPVHPDYALSPSELNDRLEQMEISDDEKETMREFDEISAILPATVVVITADGLVPCTKEYDTRLAGIISTRPAVKMACTSKGQYVALSGKVPCNVTGHIEAGDLLTTSDIPGHAQKANRFEGGAIVGKALENFDGKTGLIMVWVGGI